MQILTGKCGRRGFRSGLIYKNATLYVPKGTVDLYKKKEGWKWFFHIEEADFAGIETTKTTKGVPQLIFTMDGRAIGQHVNRGKGLRIVRYADGSARKVMVTKER